MSKGIFITATGTDVGKTYVTSLIVKKLREHNICAGYYKAALSGAKEIEGKLIPEDATNVCHISGLIYNEKNMVSYVYKTPVSPHLAAKLEGNPVSMDKIRHDFSIIKKNYDYLCIEGSGGIICPLRIDDTHTILLEDVIKELHLSVVIVALAELGTINSTLLTISYLRLRNINIAGIILNNYDETNFLHVDNKKQIENLSGISVIACVKPKETDINIGIKELKNLFKEI